MRILFLAHKTGRTRHFDSVIRMLADRGHTVRVAVLSDGPSPKLSEDLRDHPRISAVGCPSDRVDEWRDVVAPLRFARDYVRYLSPVYSDASVLRKRAGVHAPSIFVKQCARHPWLQREWRLLESMFRLVEDAIPSDRAIEAFILSERPDLVLITPLVHLGMYQADYVKSAHQLGIPIAFLPFSWDNLTNKGLIKVIPDRVIVWNDIQKREAVSLHGVPPDRIDVTGAPRFDEFFAATASGSRQEFCESQGLDPDRPYVLYLCSSEFVAPREVEFVFRWVAEIRMSEDPRLRSCGVLVRPHPAHTEQWKDVTPPEQTNVALWRSRVTKTGDGGLYDSIYHSAAVVGLNTSAQIEAGILGKAVHTIIAEEFADRQVGTLHFGYLLEENGGPSVVARSFDEHRDQLAQTLADPDSRKRQSQRFVKRFVRPHGLGRPSTPIMVDAIERVGSLSKRRSNRTPPHRLVVRAIARWIIFDRVSAEALRVKAAHVGGRVARVGGGELPVLPPPGSRRSRVEKAVGDLVSIVRRPPRRATSRPSRDYPKQDARSTFRSHATNGAIEVSADRDMTTSDMASAVGKRVRSLPSSELDTWFRGFKNAVPAERLAHFYADYDVTKRMDYARHPIELRYSSKYIKYRVGACSKEPFTVAWIEEWIKPGDVFFDVGANVGSYALVAAKHTEGRARVFAFEPSFATYADLCWNVVRNGCQDSVTPLPIALWSKSGMATFNYKVLSAGAADHRLAAGPDDRKSAYRESVLTVRLDDLVEQFDLPTPNHIKLDVDGAEIEVLQGATRALSSSQLRSILVEINFAERASEGYTEIVGILETAGLRFRSRHRRDHDRSPPYYLFTRG